ncbi:MAG: FHA domain-containing protein [Bifidobacteriaceae bacterium]|jgi:hypothetical protein|nr:FHA domain-containing protein [Bifidobacteriaceae bacterium]
MIKRYETGTWLCLSSPTATVLTDPDLGEATVAALWDAVLEGKGLADVLQVFLGSSATSTLSALPPFAAVFTDSDRAHLAVRGDFLVRVNPAGGGPMAINGRDVTAWREERAADVQGIVIEAPGGAPGRTLDLVSGVVLATRVTLGEGDTQAAEPADDDWAELGVLDEDLTTLSPAALVDEPEVESPSQAEPAVKPEPEPVPEPTVEPESEPTVEPEPLAAPVPPAESAQVSLAAVLEPVAAPEPVVSPVPVAAPEPPPPPQPVAAPEPVASPEPLEPPAEASALEATSTALWLGAPEDLVAQETPPAADAEPSEFDALWDAPTQLGTAEYAAVRQAEGAEESEGEEDYDHDGMTILKPPGSAEPPVVAVGLPPQASSLVMVLGRTCGKCRAANPPRLSQCRSCSTALVGDAVRLARPPLGLIRISTGEEAVLDRPAVIGRRPRSAKFSAGPVPHLIAVASPDISRSHLRFELEDWNVLASDLGSTNGTLLRREGFPDRRLGGKEQVLVLNGDVFDLGDAVTVAVGGIP